MTGTLGGIVEKIRATSDAMAQHSSKLNDTSEQTLAANGEISKAVEDVAIGSTNMATSISEYRMWCLEYDMMRHRRSMLLFWISKPRHILYWRAVLS